MLLLLLLQLLLLLLLLAALKKDLGVLEMIVSTKQRAGWTRTSCPRRKIYHFSFLPSPLYSFYSLSHGSVPVFSFSQPHFSVTWPLLTISGVCKTPGEPEGSLKSWMCNKEWSSKLKNLITNGPPVKNLAELGPLEIYGVQVCIAHNERKSLSSKKIYRQRSREETKEWEVHAGK